MPSESEGEALVILAGRMIWDKGIAEFVDAARELAKAGVIVRCALVGGLDRENPRGIDEEQLNTWVAEGVVEWWGAVADMSEVYHRARVVVLPSYREGMPKVLLEAAACARAVVTTDVPGCRDVVIDGQTGYLVPVRDSEALYGKIVTLLHDGEQRKMMGNAARRHAEERFATELVVSATLEVFGTLIGGKADPMPER